MLQVIFRYREGSVKLENIDWFGRDVLNLVSKAASTDEVKLTENDVDFILVSVDDDSICPPIAIEIRTIGFPERKKKMDEKCMRQLKRDIFENEYFPETSMSLDDPLIWLQFIDPDGAHV